MSHVVRRMPWPRRENPARPVGLLSPEWLVTNGLGGYASGTVAGAPTRRYHGLLVAALPVPLGRMVMLNDLADHLRLPDGRECILGSHAVPGRPRPDDPAENLLEFRLEAGLPVWRYDVDGFTIEKRVLMPHQQNTVQVTYRLVEGDGVVWLRLRPAVQFRPLEAAVSAPLNGPYTLTAVETRFELSNRDAVPPLRMTLRGDRATFTVLGQRLEGVEYLLEANRGYDAVGDLWSPGHFGADLSPEHPTVTLIASTEPWEQIEALEPELAFTSERHRRVVLLAQAHPQAKNGLGGELVLAADQFVMTPTGRVLDLARAHAAGHEVRSIIAGYHWFADWGRDTMISLEGLTLTTGRLAEAADILRTFSYYVKDGLIPNMFPDGEQQGLYHTADASLWYFHAVDRYLQTTGDRTMLQILLPTLVEVFRHHMQGTRFGIGVDPADGLLRQGAEGYQLTWMDAKVDDWVVTPRRGKAVEINALWYNALRLLEGWLRAERGDAAAGPVALQADRVYQSFNDRFWYAAGGYLYDVVDGENGDDPACRPNQLFAVSLPHAVLTPERWEPVVRTVQEKLLTPYGLRSLAPEHPDYKPQYFGDLRARDAAYHQGTVWAWLIGPFVDAWLKLHPDDRLGARRFLDGFADHLGEAGVGSISEIFDAEPPFTPRGCVAQAWSVAEVLRCWAKTAR